MRILEYDPAGSLQGDEQTVIVVPDKGTKRITIDDVQEYLWEKTWKKIYPVGALYISYTSTSPASLFGGSWTQITGRFLRAANDANTGGADTVTLTTAQMPSHTHTVGIKKSSQELATVGLVSTNPSFAGRVLIEGSPSGVTYTSSSTGSGNSHSNTPAYQDVYVWRRTA